MKSIMLALLMITAPALASDAGTATPELCKSKGMAYVKAQDRVSVKGKPYKVRAHCRKKPGKAVKE